MSDPKRKLIKRVTETFEVEPEVAEVDDEAEGDELDDEEEPEDEPAKPRRRRK